MVRGVAMGGTGQPIGLCEGGKLGYEHGTEALLSTYPEEKRLILQCL